MKKDIGSLVDIKDIIISDGTILVFTFSIVMFFVKFFWAKFLTIDKRQESFMTVDDVKEMIESKNESLLSIINNMNSRMEDKLETIIKTLDSITKISVRE